MTSCGAFRVSHAIANIPISCEKENIDRMSFSLSVHVALLEKRLRYKYHRAPIITRQYSCLITSGSHGNNSVNNYSIVTIKVFTWRITLNYGNATIFVLFLRLLCARQMRDNQRLGIPFRYPPWEASSGDAPGELAGIEPSYANEAVDGA